MNEGYYYIDIPDILQALQAEGLPLSVNEVHKRRQAQRQGIDKGGSLASISADVKRWKREQGIIGAEAFEEDADDEERPLQALDGAYIPLPPDASEVQRHLEDLRGESALLELLDHLERLVASARALEPLEQMACNWLYRTMERDMGESLMDVTRWSALHSSTQAVIAAASSSLREMRRGYRRIQQVAVHEEGG